MFGLREIAEIMGGEIQPGKEARGQGAPAGVSIDTRRLTPGEIFFAIRGGDRDGHDFVSDAFARGAAAAVVYKNWQAEEGPGTLIRVSNPVEALQSLAAHYRRSLKIQIAGITGSNGKTTTKDMAARILSRRYRTAKTEGNLNNHLGVPLTLLAMPEDTEVAVIEMGMNHLGEIRRLAEISLPEVGVITNIGEGHLEFLGSMENVLKAKAELLEYLGPEHTAVLNADDPYLSAGHLSVRARVVTFGIDHPADVKADRVETMADKGVRFSLDGCDVQLGVPGREFVYDALAAVAVAITLGVPAPEACEALRGFCPYRMRMEMIRAGSVTVINDAYNANPASMRAALATVGEMAAEGRKVAVLGEMLELGVRAPVLHREIGERVALSGIHLLLTHGPLAREIGAGAVLAGMPEVNVRHFGTRETLTEALKDSVRPGDVVLVKGSRACRMETFAETLVSAFTR